MKNNIDYYGMLLDFIPIRKRYKSYAGSEGIAYFVSPNFVLKEYTKSDDWESFDKIFECYCSEIQACSRAGMAVSEIYSWVKVPNMGHYTKGDKNAYQYFILEERVPGRELYFGNDINMQHIIAKNEVIMEEEIIIELTKGSWDPNLLFDDYQPYFKSRKSYKNDSESEEI